MSANSDKEIQSIDSIETYAYGTVEEIKYKKEDIKCNNIIKNTKTINIDYVTKEHIKEHNPNSWSSIKNIDN